MAKKPSVTFKNEPKITGLASVDHSAGATIKVGGMMVGSITGWSYHSTKHKIRLMIVEGDSWKWIELKHQGESLPATKEWVKAHWDAITERYTLHATEPY